MKVKLANLALAAGLIDPHTRRSPFIGADGKPVETADVPETSHWIRRVMSGEVARIAETEPTPTGSEPVKPLTTR